MVLRLCLAVAFATAVTATGQPPAPAARPGQVDFSMLDAAKLFNHVTVGEMQAWLKSPPGPSAEAAARFAEEQLAAMAVMDRATAYMNAGEHVKARDTAVAAVARLRNIFTDAAPAVGLAYGFLGVTQLLAEDKPGAEDSFGKFKACMRRLYPADRFPDGHPMMASALMTFNAARFEYGDHAAAEAEFRDALRMYLKLGPANPDGSDLTTLYVLLATAALKRNDADKAEEYARVAHTRCEQLCGTPAGRAEFTSLLATAKNNLAEVLRAKGDAAGADKYFAEAGTIRAAAGPADRGKRAILLRNQAVRMMEGRNVPGAIALLDEAAREAETAFPAAEFPAGHPYLLTVLRDRGGCLAAAGRVGEADAALARALAMAGRLYPDARCPDGHPEVAAVLSQLGSLRLRSPVPADRRAAAGYFRDAFAISLGHTRAQAAYQSEAAMLAQCQGLGDLVCGLLSGPPDPRDYWFLWESKATVMRILDRRRRAAVGTADPAVRLLVEDLAAVRRKLEAALLAPAGDPAVAGAADLTRQKEDLEARLARAQGLPLPDRGGVTPGDLAAALPGDAAFVDYWKFLKVDHDPADAGNAGRRAETCYAAFVVAPRKWAARIDLGPAAEIDDAVAQWLARIAQDPPDPVAERQAAKRVADLIWVPVRNHFPTGTTTVYICPDGAVCRVPFAALPDRARGGVLAEDLAAVVVPHGQGLYRHLTAPRPRIGGGAVLTIGGVTYAAGGPPALPGTVGETTAVAAVAGRGGRAPVVALAGGAATPDGVLAALPSARFAHFATHGRADDPADTAAARPAWTPADIRSPLARCRLALAGAEAGSGRGWLSGEAIVGVKLDGLEVAVLSACDTARGGAAGGEGVFGLPRAFHVAGCPAVVASLWKVDDVWTAALIARFYHHLWDGAGLPPAAALRQAQLDIYRSPADRTRWAAGDTRSGVPAGPAAVLPTAPPVVRESLPRLWAAFQLSIGG